MTSHRINPETTGMAQQWLEMDTGYLSKEAHLKTLKEFSTKSEDYIQGWLFLLSVCKYIPKGGRVWKHRCA